MVRNSLKSSKLKPSNFPSLVNHQERTAWSVVAFFQVL